MFHVPESSDFRIPSSIEPKLTFVTLALPNLGKGNDGVNGNCRSQPKYFNIIGWVYDLKFLTFPLKLFFVFNWYGSVVYLEM